MPQKQGGIIYRSACKVLSEMGKIKKGSFKLITRHNEAFKDAIIIEVVLSGSISGFVVFAYPKAFVKNLILLMTGSKPNTVNEQIILSMMELSHEIAKNIGKQYAVSCEIREPFVSKRLKLRPDERVAIDTGLGIIEIDVSVF